MARLMYLHESFRHRRRLRLGALVIVALSILVMLAAIAIVVAGVATAAEPDEVVVAVASEAGVDPVLLEGAMLTTGLEARPYLWMTGELSRPRVTAPSWPWDALAACESNGRWHVDAYHDGGLQFLPSTWLAYGGGQYARYAWQATREQQIDIAIRVQRAAGWGQWPVCSRRIGLR